MSKLQDQFTVIQIDWFELAKQICTPPEPEHVEGCCDRCGDEVDDDCNLCPRCIRNYALNEAMDAKRDEQIERELEGKR